MRPVDLRKLRIDLYGKDKLDSDAEGTYPDFTLFDCLGEIVTRTTVIVTRQKKPKGLTHTGRLGHPSGHRVYCKCPDCGKVVPAGRLAQHHKVHGNLNEVLK